MKIIVFHHKTESSAIIQMNTMSQNHCASNRQITNSILAHGYHDRFLWEEAASLRPQEATSYAIPGNWQ